MKLKQLDTPVNDHFTRRGQLEHNHEPDYGTEVRAELIQQAKEQARVHTFESARTVVEGILNDRPALLPREHHVNPGNLIRQINRGRSVNYPKLNFEDPNFEVNMTFVEGKNLLLNICVNVVII